MTSALISFLRTLVFQLAALLLLPALWGIDGVWLAVTAAELAALAVSALLSGNLGYDPNVHCDHHDHEHGEDGHTCGDHGCGKHSCH